MDIEKRTPPVWWNFSKESTPNTGLIYIMMKKFGFPHSGFGGGYKEFG